MGGQAAEQIIAGVVLSERLAVTMYGAIHRAQFGGQRNLRGLVVDPKMLAEDAFRIPLTDPKWVASSMTLSHPSIVPTIAVESNGPDVVVVMRGSGRYVTVQDLITAASARGKSGKLPLPIAALIGKSVIEALAAAHAAGVIHGAVHPHSVLIDEEGGVQLGDFIVGRALTTAVAQGADSSLWRGLAGYIAPELVVGEDPAPGVDVFAVGAMLFAMLTGEVPPGALRATPAIERLVQRALDTDPQRRYKSAGDLLENLSEAMEDDRWDIAERAELVREAGLSHADTNIDQATEDLLASLGSKTDGLQVPIRPSVDLRAEQSAARMKSPGAKGLDALLQGLDEPTGLTAVEEPAFRRDPISEIIKRDPRKAEAIVQPSRVPSLDDPDDMTPIPPPARESDLDMTRSANPRRSSQLEAARPRSADEQAALDAIGSLDESGVKRASSPPPAEPKPQPKPAKQPKPATPIVDPIAVEDVAPPRLKSRWPGVIAILALGGLGYFIYYQYTKQEQASDDAKKKEQAAKQKHDEDEQRAREAQPDPGAIKITSNPSQAGVWLKLGYTPVDSIQLPANHTEELALVLDGYELGEAQVAGPNWTGAGKAQKASISVTLAKATKKAALELPLQPKAINHETGVVGEGGPIHVESTPAGAEVWLFIGITNDDQLNNITAGRDYEVAVVKPGYKTQKVSIKQDEWRDGGSRDTPIDVAKKKATIERAVELVADPNAKPEKKGR